MNTAQRESVAEKQRCKQEKKKKTQETKENIFTLLNK